MSRYVLNISTPSSGSKKKPSKTQVSSAYRLFLLVSYLASSSTLKMEAIYASEMSVDLAGLHGVISRNI
jgi:hypothetical protein